MKINSKLGELWFNQITDIYKNCEVMIKIYEAQGEQMDTDEAMLEDFIKQLFPQTATWGLFLWENQFNIPTNFKEPLEVRRERVLGEMQKKIIITPANLAELVYRKTGANIVVKEWVGEYKMEIITSSFNLAKYKEISEEVLKLKPAHMKCEIIYKDEILNTDANIKSCFQITERVVVGG